MWKAKRRRRSRKNLINLASKFVLNVLNTEQCMGLVNIEQEVKVYKTVVVCELPLKYMKV